MGYKRKVIESRQKTPFKPTEKAKLEEENQKESDYESENEVNSRQMQ
jgi:hypothetical protein